METASATRPVPGVPLDERVVACLRDEFPHYVGTKPLRFVNEAELYFARILERWGVDWDYEPRTFELEHAPDGHVTFAFTPDFFLVAGKVYIETTIMRQSRTARKHRKLRLLHEQFPDVLCIVLYRRDLERLGTAYGFALPPVGENVPFRDGIPAPLRLAARGTPRVSGVRGRRELGRSRRPRGHAAAAGSTA